MTNPYRDEAARDMAIETQPILWAQAMLEQAEQCPFPDARDAILSRIGCAFFGRFGMVLDLKAMRQAHTKWSAD